MTSAFISYWQKHSDFVDFLDVLLKKWDVDVFVDRRGLRSGGMSHQLGNQILQRLYFLLVATRRSVKRYWVKGEYDFAYTNEKRDHMIPLMLELFSLKEIFPLSSLVYVNFTGWHDNYNIHDATWKLARMMEIKISRRQCRITTDEALAETVLKHDSSAYTRDLKAQGIKGDKFADLETNRVQSVMRVENGIPAYRLAKPMFKTGQRARTTGMYRWAMYSDGTRQPMPQPEERQIRIERGDVFPPIRSSNKAAWWQHSGLYPRNPEMPAPHKPGETVYTPGEYLERGPRGGRIHRANVVTIEKGEKLPPTQRPGRTWERIGPRKPYGSGNTAEYMTGEKAPRTGNYDWVRYTDGTTYPAPTAEERRIRLEAGEGERFPPISSAGKAAFWRWAGTR